MNLKPAEKTKKIKKDVFKDIKQGMVPMLNIKPIDSLDQLEYPVKIHYDFDLKI